MPNVNHFMNSNYYFGMISSYFLAKTFVQSRHIIMLTHLCNFNPFYMETGVLQMYMTCHIFTEKKCPPSKQQQQQTIGRNIIFFFNTEVANLYSLKHTSLLHSRVNIVLFIARPDYLSVITKTRPCNIQQYFTAVKMLIFR